MIYAAVAVIVAGKKKGMRMIAVEAFTMLIFSRKNGGALGIFDALAFRDTARLTHDGPAHLFAQIEGIGGARARIRAGGVGRERKSHGCWAFFRLARRAKHRLRPRRGWTKVDHAPAAGRGAPAELLQIAGVGMEGVEKRSGKQCRECVFDFSGIRFGQFFFCWGLFPFLRRSAVCFPNVPPSCAPFLPRKPLRAMRDRPRAAWDKGHAPLRDLPARHRLDAARDRRCAREGTRHRTGDGPQSMIPRGPSSQAHRAGVRMFPGRVRRTVLRASRLEGYPPARYEEKHRKFWRFYP